MGNSSLGVFNQVAWYGVGDVDECWIIATYWALVAAGVMAREDLPTIAEFRNAAGKPDKKGPTGGNNGDLLLGLKSLGIKGDFELFSGGISAFTRMMKKGYIASLSVSSKALPAYLQFGFKGTHQISVYYQGGKFYVMNPLAKEGSSLIEISAKDLEHAAAALLHDGRFHALFIKSSKATKAKDLLKQSTIRPRDLNAPIFIRDYIDPWATRGALAARRPKNGLGQ